MFEQIYNALLSNQVFGGLVGGSLVATVLFALKGVPLALWEGLVWRFTTRLTVFNEDPSFDKVNEWLSSLEYIRKARNLQITSQEVQDEKEIFYAPGVGYHFLWHNGVPILVQRSVPKNSGQGWRRREDITIQTVGWSTKPIKDLIKEITHARSLSRQNQTDVYLYNNNWWRLSCRKAKRPLHTIFIPEQQKTRIIHDLQVFLNRREWYQERGIPYRRGLLFEGPPGCGKTSLVMALAAHFSKPIYALNLGSIENDNDLFQAVSSAPEAAILLIEDIDAAKAVAPRVEEKDEDGNTLEKKDTPKVISLSGLLNAIDGAFAKDGRILIMTTNHPDKIDPALIRPGRADRREHIGLLQEHVAARMCDHILGVDNYDVLESLEFPVAPALLQEKLLERTSPRA